MKRSILALVFLAQTLLLGCSKEDPHPELKDPIYQDLKKRADDLLKAKDEAYVKVKDLTESLEKAEPNSIERKDIERDLMKTRKLASESEQMATYYRIRSERRRVEGRLAYKKAFREKKPWPDADEYSDYLVNRRLNEVNLNWNSRVPKLQDRLVMPKKAEETGDAAASSGGH